MKISDIQIKFDNFEGALDVLLNLLEKNKIDIYDIPISFVLEQFLEIIKEIDNKNIEIVSDFIEIVSELITIKSKLLLPINSKEIKDYIDPRFELVERLLEYKKIKELSVYLENRYEIYGGIFIKENSINIYDYGDVFYKNIDTYIYEKDILKKMYLDVISKIKYSDDDLEQGLKNLKYLKKKFMNVNEKVNYLNKNFFDNKEILKQGFSFNELIEENDKYSIIVTFLAVLEIIKDKKINIYQDGLCGEIFFKYE